MLATGFNPCTTRQPPTSGCYGKLERAKGRQQSPSGSELWRGTVVSGLSASGCADQRSRLLSGQLKTPFRPMNRLTYGDRVAADRHEATTKLVPME